MPRGAKNDFDPHWTEIVCSSFKLNHILQAYTINDDILLILHVKQPTGYCKDQFLMKYLYVYQYIISIF